MQTESREEETHLFHRYIQRLRVRSQLSIACLCARLEDPSSGSPVSVERDDGLIWIEWYNQQLTNVGRRSVSPDPAVPTCNEIGDAGEESIAGVMPAGVMPGYLDSAFFPSSSSTPLEQRPLQVSFPCVTCSPL
jgi:hypothetical protein